MISSYHLLVAFLFLLLPFSSPQSTPPPSIAFNKENGDAYFVRESCISNTTISKVLIYQEKYLASEQCDIVIHTRKRGLQKLFVEIDIQFIPSISGSTKLNPAKSITIEQSQLNIECNSDEVILHNDPMHNGPKFTIGQSPIVYFTKDRLFCSFIVQTSDDNFPATSKSLELKFHPKTGNGEVLTYSEPLWSRGHLFCDSVDTFEREDSEFYLKNAEIEDGKVIKCPVGTTFFEIDSSLRLVDFIECSSGKWKWSIGRNIQEMPKTFRVACGIRVCSQCTENMLTEKECRSCSKAQFVKRFDECAQIKCSSNKWILDEKWANNPTIKCVKNSGGSFGWTAKGIEVKSGACTSKFDCVTHSDMKLKCNAKKGLCQDVILSADRMTISCNENDGFFLGYGNVTPRPERILECDENTGLFKEGLEDVPTKQTLGCYKVKGRTRRRQKPSVSSSSKTATGSIPLYSWLPIVIIALILCIGGALAFFFMKRRQSMEEAEGEDQQSKDQSQSKMTETEGVMVTNRAAVVRDCTRVKLTKADSEIVKEEKIIKSESSHSDRDFDIEGKTETEASTDSEKSTKSTKSRKTGQVNIVPYYHRKRELNKNLVAPLIEPYVITKENMVPIPRNSKNCPDSYSTDMDVPNPRLRARTTSTNVNQQSRATTGDGTTTMNQQSGTTADGTTTGNQRTGTTADGTTTGNQRTGTTADGTTTNQQNGATQSGVSGANSSSENKKSV